jgi:hypothetical protein
VLAMMIASGSASAQTAEAESLFQQGKALMKEGKTAEACEKFEASDKLEPGVGIEANLGRCREKVGQTARAWAAYKKMLATAKRLNDEDGEREASARVKELEPQLVHLTIKVPLEHDVDGLVIKRNDSEIDRALWDQEMPVDPDEYTISAEAPGRKTWTETVVVRKKDKVIEVPKLERKKKDKDRERDKDQEAIEPSGSSHGRQYGTAMWTLAGAGAGAIVLGTGLALYANDVAGQADAICPNIKCGDPHAVDLNHTARLDATIADVAWGLGGAALVGAVALYFAGAPSGSDAVSVAPVVGRGHTGIAIGGRF